MSARRAMLEDIDFDLDAGEFVPARRGLPEPEAGTTAILPKYEAQRAFAKPATNDAKRRNRALIGAGLAAAFALVPIVAPVHAEYAKAPQPADLVEYQDVTLLSMQSAAAEDAAARAEQRREAAAEAQRQAEAEAKRQAEEAERRAAEEARQRAEAEAQAQREREQAASRNAQRTAQPAQNAPAAATQPQQGTEMAIEVNGDVAGAIQYAMAQQGKPYQWGGTGPNGYDCSGLVYAAYRSIGITLPRTSGAMASAGRPVASVADLQPGDIIISYGGGHAAMYIGNGMVVEALNYGIPVKTSPLPSGITAMRRVIG